MSDEQVSGTSVVKSVDANFDALQKTLESDSEKLTQDNYISRHIFVIGDLGYILPTNLITEVVRDLFQCRLPNSPDFILGMGSSRGKVFPIFDLHILFGISRPEEKYTLLVHLSDESTVAVMVNDIPNIISMSQANKINPLPALNKHILAYVKTAYQAERVCLDVDLTGFFKSLNVY